MGTIVVCLREDKLVVWSNTVDAPVSPVLGRNALIELLAGGEQLTYEQARALVELAERQGTTDPAMSLADVLAENCAGANEEHLTLEQIIALYS